ncbi:hypothetical protein FisN_16Lh110 [Fistulifera solaris]|uniref:Uncharacterized protein n=1 Tax=Fistulifera solaris TaxID=1519565 RepID=A0A1Z5KJ30_FISSO|nr:hypothetical protein FisN_16Lh110 [Fistulifera solaris]|eukprot:GAX26279.1 hypothetical protein FisN_16Lh110 [Fistulifera solaris]
MKSKHFYPPLSSEHFYKDEEPTHGSMTSLPLSPSSSSQVFSASSPLLNSYNDLRLVSPAVPGTSANETRENKKGMLSKMFGRRKSTGPMTTNKASLFEQRPLTKNLSSKALDRLQASEQCGPIDRMTPPCSDLSGDSGIADNRRVSRRPKETAPVFKKGNTTLDRIPDLPPLQTPLWVPPKERTLVSPKRRASVTFDNSQNFESSQNNSASCSSFMIESPAPTVALKPPPLVFQESDQKLPAVKSPPPVDFSETTTDDNMMFEIEPGHSLLLRGRKQETIHYIQGGKDIATQECVCCEGIIHCVGDASFLLCPFCRVVQPLLLTSSERDAYGLALGFSSQEWIEMYAEEDAVV